MANIIKINPLKVIPAPWNTRSAIDEASIKSLAESIKADGIIQTPNCIRNEDGDLVCYDGNRRVAAACLIGLDEIEVAVNDITEDEAKVKTVTANLQREDDDPLLAASVIASMGGDPEVIASKLGKTTAWVKRRAKLNALTDEIKAYSGKVTLEALERVSDLPDAQQKKLAKDIDNRIKWSGGNTVKWCDIKRTFDSLTYELDSAIFDTDDCRSCMERTGAEWFAEDTDGETLGRCLNCKCHAAKVAAHKAAAVAALGDAEKVEVAHEYMVPYEVRNDGGEKRTKKHPCAYYWFEGDGEMKVVWGKSKSQIEAAQRAKQEAAEAERAERRADDDRNRKIADTITDWLSSEAGEVRMRTMLNEWRTLTDEARDMVIDRFIEWLGDWLGREDAALVTDAFGLADTIGISAEDFAWFKARNVREEEADDNESNED